RTDVGLRIEGINETSFRRPAVMIRRSGRQGRGIDIDWKMKVIVREADNELDGVLRLPIIIGVDGFTGRARVYVLPPDVGWHIAGRKCAIEAGDVGDDVAHIV